jgi:hypothetical protein
MSDLLPAGAKVSPSTARNRDSVLEILKSRLPKTGIVLEIVAGSGEHRGLQRCGFFPAFSGNRPMRTPMPSRA